MFAIETYASHRPRRIQYFAWLASLILLVMVLAQLFTYEDFPATMSALLATTDTASVTLISALIVTGEVFALPYLLAMRLSVLMRTLSALSVAIVAIFWFFIVLTSAHASNSGLFGNTVVIPGGMSAALIIFVLVGCTIYSLLWSIHETSSRPLR